MNSKEASTLNETLARLGEIRSALALQLPDILDLSLEKSFARILKQPATESINPYLDSFCLNLSEYLEKNKRKNNELCDSLIKCPVIQQADHSGILLDNEIFLNNIFFSVALSSKSIPCGITIQCSTVKCISSRAPLRGPLFLNDDGNHVRLSDITNSKLKNK